VWDVIRAIATRGTTVLLTTQYLEEADRLAERLAVIDQGRLIAEGTNRELKASVGASRLHVRLRRPDQRVEAGTLLARSLGAKVFNGADASVLSANVRDEQGVAEALSALARSGVHVEEFSLGSPTLDEVFMTLTGHLCRTDEGRDAACESPEAAPPTGGRAP
jgi:ABC-2 type transport system ATP-binding protein